MSEVKRAGAVPAALFLSDRQRVRGTRWDEEDR